MFMKEHNLVISVQETISAILCNPANLSNIYLCRYLKKQKTFYPILVPSKYN